MDKSILDTVRTWYYILKYQVLLGKIDFGKNTLIKSRLSIKGPGKVRVGDNCIFESDPWGDDYVTFYTHKKEARIVIGNNVTLRATRFGSHLEIDIKDNTVLENASIFDSDFHNTDANKRDDGFNEHDKKVIIGQGSYVGCESLCSKGTELGKDVIMVPVSVAGTKFFPDNSKIGGFPAKRLRCDRH